METAEIRIEGDHATIHLPRTWDVTAQVMTVRRDAGSIVLEPLKPTSWPPNFFEEIRVSDENFKRLPQGTLPPVKSV